MLNLPLAVVGAMHYPMPLLCDCAETDSDESDYCRYDGNNYSKDYTDYSGVSLSETLTGNEVKFENLHGNLTAGLSSSPGSDYLKHH